MDEIARNAIKQAVAASILAALDGSARDALIEQAIVDFVSDYKLKHVVAELVTARAKAMAEELIASGKYDERIRDALQQGFDAVIAKVPEAARVAILRAVVGKDGDSYGREPGLMLKGFM